MDTKLILKLLVGIPAGWFIVNFIIGFIKAARDFEPCQYRTATTRCYKAAEDLTPIGWLCRKHIIESSRLTKNQLGDSYEIPDHVLFGV